MTVNGNGSDCPGGTGSVSHETRADRIDRFPALRHRLVDDRHGRRGGAVAVAEGTATQHWHFQRLEVAVAGDVRIDDDLRGILLRPPFNPDRLSPGVEVLQRHRVGRRGVHDTGRMPQALEDLGVQTLGVRGRLRPVKLPKNRGGHDAVAAVVAEVHGVEIHEALEQQRRTDQQHERDRHLGDDQRGAQPLSCRRLHRPAPRRRASPARCSCGQRAPVRRRR